MLDIESFLMAQAQAQGLGLDARTRLQVTLDNLEQNLGSIFTEAGGQLPQVGLRRWVKDQEQKAPLEEVISAANAAAESFDHPYIGTEHFVIGLAQTHPELFPPDPSFVGRDSEWQAQLVVRLRKATEFIIGRGEQTAIGERGYTPQVRKIFEGLQSSGDVFAITPTQLLSGIVSNTLCIGHGILDATNMLGRVTQLLSQPNLSE